MCFEIKLRVKLQFNGRLLAVEHGDGQLYQMWKHH